MENITINTTTIQNLAQSCFEKHLEREVDAYIQGYMIQNVDEIRKQIVDNLSTYFPLKSTPIVDEAETTETVEAVEAEFPKHVRDSYRILFNGCKSGDTADVKWILKDPRISPTASNNFAIREATKNGFVEIVDILNTTETKQFEIIQSSSTSTQNETITTHDLTISELYTKFNHSCKKGDIVVFKECLKDVRMCPSSANNFAIRKATECKHFEIIKILLEHEEYKLGTIDPSINSNRLLKSLKGQSDNINLINTLLKNKKVMGKCRREESVKDNRSIALKNIRNRYTQC
jgi:hypothetical protein